MVLIIMETRNTCTFERVAVSKSPMMKPTAEQIPSSLHVQAPASRAAASLLMILDLSAGSLAMVSM